MTVQITRPSYAGTGPLGDLARFGDAPALVDAHGTTTHAELAERVRERAALLGLERRLVLLECRNDVETVVTHLAALQGGHPVLLVGADCPHAELAATYRPSVVARGADLDVRRAPDLDLHPDLALLLSTSGSTGSPKLVRLSHENVRSNAAAIADFLHLDGDDRAATTLPLQYCYGLSVLHSHLLVGGSLLLTDRSVVEDAFWEDFARAGATSFAGVPHTFRLLDTSGFAERSLPTLRTITQAGGRLAPDDVRRWAGLGRERGFDLVVMYGQTEATARMAYLPPHLAADRPGCIGVPIPGGDVRLDLVAGDVGELVYSGPNVMLGYAESPADLALGRTVHELRTGDLARQHTDGLLELVGRSSRFAKLFGLRVDLDRIEGTAAEQGLDLLVVEHDDALQLFVTRHRDVGPALRLAASMGLPEHAVVMHVLAGLPLTDSGKPDRGALVEHARAADRVVEERRDSVVRPEHVRDIYAVVLGRPHATVDDSFVDLRGDSLSYVEASVRLGRLVDPLPVGWSTRTPRQLAELARPARRWWAHVETGVLLRAVAIVVIVCSHADLIDVMGGAHVLLAVLGFNLARFQLSDHARLERRRRLFRAAAVVAVPSVLWIAGAAWLTGEYDARTALLLTNLSDAARWTPPWQYWFIGTAVWTLVLAAIVLPLRGVDRLERRDPFAFAAAVFGVLVGWRYLATGIEAGPLERYAVPTVLWCVALGWMAARARTDAARLVTTVAAVVACWGFFGDPERELVVAGGIALLVWVPRVRCPRVLLPVLGAVASSSMFVYLTHWQVYPDLEDAGHQVLAVLASFAVGMLVWRLHDLVRRSLPRPAVGRARRT